MSSVWMSTAMGRASSIDKSAPLPTKSRIARIDWKVGVQFTKIVDSYQEPETESPSESALFDEGYWTKTYPAQSALARQFQSMASHSVEDVRLRWSTTWR
jgi:hypothetical protein